jgi:hypothetical protein
LNGANQRGSVVKIGEESSSSRVNFLGRERSYRRRVSRLPLGKDFALESSEDHETAVTSFLEQKRRRINVKGQIIRDSSPPSNGGENDAGLFGGMGT